MQDKSSNIDCLCWPTAPLYGNARNVNPIHERTTFVSIAGRDFCFHAKTCGCARWLLAGFIWHPIKLSYLLIIVEIRPRPLTTYGNTKTNVRGSSGSPVDYVPCTPTFNLVLSLVISFQILLSPISRRNTEVSTNFHLNLFIFYLLIKHVNVVHACHSCDVISDDMSSAHLCQFWQGHKS